MGNRVILYYCIYCKTPIYEDETYVVCGKNKYHAVSDDEHDNCYELLLETEKE